MKIILTLLLFGFVSCSTSKKEINSLIVNIETVYYQKWVAGIADGGKGINFHLVLKQPLDENYQFEKVNFQSHSGVLEKISETEYSAKLNLDKTILILDLNPVDEYGNKQPDIKDESTKALVYFSFKNKKHMLLFKKVKEKPMLAYPSVKPKN